MVSKVVEIYLTKFGVAQTDEITMVISQQRFSDLISQFLSDLIKTIKHQKDHKKEI